MCHDVPAVEETPRPRWAPFMWLKKDVFRLKKDRDIIDYIDLALKVTLPVFALLLSVRAYQLQEAIRSSAEQERRIAAVEEIERRHGATMAAREADASQVSAVLLELALRGSALERRAAVLGLAQIAPRRLLDESSALLLVATSEDEKAMIRDITGQASDHDVITRFLNEVMLSREFFRRELYERACEEYAASAEGWPKKYGDRMDEEGLHNGRALCAAGRYDDGAKALHAAFSKIPQAR